jgi:glutathione synthase/RimK-type ligase-like ATP-grasp enzyme
MLRLAVVGNPENRRIGLLCKAAADLGTVEPRVVPWLDVLQGAARFHAGELVRIDSPGEDAEVARLLRGESEPVDMYRVEGSRAWYEGFVKALDQLHASIEAAGAHALADAEETATAFDKARCHAMLSEHGISVPAAVPGVVGFESLVASQAELGWTGVYAKIRHGSSASGVVEVRQSGQSGQSRGALRALTSTELHRTPDGFELYNSLRIRRYARESDIAMVIDRLALDGLHVETAVDKLRIGGRVADLRLVAVGGRVTHAVGRSSEIPITNLHLGGRRQAAHEYRERVGDERWAQIIGLAERTAACFPRSHCLGIDVLSDHARDYIGEVNAYGDLLPGLLGLPGTLGEGRDTYAAQLASLQTTHG